MSGRRFRIGRTRLAPAMRWRLRFQLLVPLLTLLVGVTGLSAWAAVAAVGRARERIESQVRSVARTLGEARFPLNPPVLEHMKGLSGADYLLLTADARLSTLSGEPSDLPDATTLADDWQHIVLRPGVTVGGQRYLCGGVRLTQPDHVLFILYPESLWRDALWEAGGPPLFLGGFVVLASVLLAVMVGRRLTRRIADLERHTRVIAAGDFGPMPLPYPDDELRDLARSVNEMADRLARLHEAVEKNERLRLLGQLGGGLAHQLRNSVTGARLAVQVHARACPTAAEDEAIDVALRQLDLVEVTLRRFLDLGKESAVRREPCALPALVDGAVELLRPQCRHEHIDLRWQPGDSPVPVVGDPVQLGHLILNLLTNALEAAGPGGRVALRVGVETGEVGPLAVLEVRDSGPGPPPALASRLFEPFVTGKPEGVGLGLVVAQRVAEAHGGRLQWHREPDATCFRVELPAASQ